MLPEFDWIGRSKIPGSELPAVCGYPDTSLKEIVIVLLGLILTSDGGAWSWSCLEQLSESRCCSVA